MYKTSGPYSIVWHYCPTSPTNAVGAEALISDLLSSILKMSKGNEILIFTLVPKIVFQFGPGTFYGFPEGVPVAHW